MYYFLCETNPLPNTNADRNSSSLSGGSVNIQSSHFRKAMRQKPAGKKLRDLIPLLPPQLVDGEPVENENTGSIPLIQLSVILEMVYRRVIWNILTTFIHSTSS